MSNKQNDEYYDLADTALKTFLRDVAVTFDTCADISSDGQVLSSTIQERFLRMGKQARDFADE